MGRCVRGVRDWIRCCRERKAKVIEKEKHRTLKACGLWEQDRIR